MGELAERLGDLTGDERRVQPKWMVRYLDGFPNWLDTYRHVDLPNQVVICGEQPIADYRGDLLAALVMDAADEYAMGRWLALSEELRDLHETLGERLPDGAWHVENATTLQRVRAALSTYQSQQHSLMAGAQQLQDEVITNLLALKLVLETVSMATTHQEKNARLRGVTDLLDVSIQRLREYAVDDHHWRDWRGAVLAGDSTVSRVQRDLWDAQEELQRYRQRYGALTEDAGDERVPGNADTIPF